MLIVCEGEKTEPNYFGELKDHYSLNSANIEITGEGGSSPSDIFALAKQKYKEAKEAGNSFDRVYCVFDKDSWPCYQQTANRIATQTPKETFFLASSVPCFEYWLLLHFEYHTRPYAPLPGNSVGNQVLRDLKKYMPHYEKSYQGVFQELLAQIDYAKAGAERSLAAGGRNDTDNPTTRVHLLVDFLANLK